MVDTCNVTGPLIDPSGTVLPATEIVFVYPEVTGNPAGVVIPKHIRATSDGAGLIDVDLVPGNCTGIVVVQGRAVDFPVAVPDAASALFRSIVNTAAVDLPVQALVDAQAVLAAMVQIFNVVVLNSIGELPVSPAANTVYYVRA